MEQALEKLHEINRLLLENAKEETDLGLLHGKLGLSIYFYHLAKKTRNHEYNLEADKLIGELFEKLSETKLPIDFENGLTGMAWGISYLVNSDFVEANLDETLAELDDRIFRFLEDQKNHLSADFRSGILGYLTYYLDRLENSLKSGHTSNIYIFQKLAAVLLNQLGQLVEEEKLKDREPQLFNIFWDLPITLIILGKSKKLHVNSAKAERILDYIIPSIISFFPNLHSNRLYLLLGLESVLREIENPILRRHALFLKKNIDIKSIFNEEFKNLNIRVLDGASGLRLIAKMLAEITGDDSYLPSEVLFFCKINESVCWGEADFYSSIRQNIGLVSGLSGIGLALLETLEVEKKI